MNRWHYQIIYHLHHFILKFRQHLAWLYTLIILSTLLSLLNISQGDVKVMEVWSWLDITGEGASVLFIAVWLTILLASRSKGRTTTLLALGLLGVYLSNLQDFIDEFIKLPKDRFPWDSLIESLPIGLVLFTTGMVYWYREQQLIQTHLAQRNAVFKNSPSINRETGLAPMKAMLTEIEQLLPRAVRSIQLNLLYITVDGFNQTATEKSELKRYCADVLLNQSSKDTHVYHLTGNHYAVLTNVTSDQNEQMMTSLKKPFSVAMITNKTP
ncbi:hypothetical protein [Psychromonas sp. KJ10-2]|uniref:hypothetical protein n=1 Tax=Psychromonas sp. KJ10-2 TaxID=3391822 RepID=UPI0039B4A166